MKTKLLLSACVLTALYGCQSSVSTKQIEKLSCVLQVPHDYSTVLIAPNNAWSECFNHQQDGLFESVVDRVKELVKAPNSSTGELNKLLYYLRAYAYYAEVNALTSEQWDKLNSALHAVAVSPNTEIHNDRSFRTLEHLYVALYQYSSHKNNSVAAEFATATLTRAIHLQPLEQDSLAYQYQLLELYRSIGFLSYQARRQTELKSALTNSQLAEQLVQHINLLTESDWRLENALWALASLHYLLPKQRQAEIDQRIIEHIFNRLTVTDTEKKQLFSHIYLANSYRYNEQCDAEFNGLCSIPSIDQILPINHHCSDSLYIRATELTQSQLTATCQKLTSQEAFFHRSLATKEQPVKNDLNHKLRVVIFDNYSHYNQWGQLVFNIGTDNGGMYIEGKPDQQGNQATFYSFEAFWQQPSFSIWNLNHEYVHYLDGRFVKYGAYGHYPSHTVWWSEGLAEYISVQKQNKRAFDLLNQLEQKDWPTLAQIFATKYSDGLDRVYRWSYLAIRFLFELHPEQGQKLANALRSDNFELYKEELQALENTYQQGFTAWLLANQPEIDIPTPESDNRVKRYKGKPLYRYLYRSYLRPDHLPIDKQHYHFSNWG